MKPIILDDIKQLVDQLAARINAGSDLLPTYGYSKDFGYPHIETTGNLLHWVVKERGEELQRRTTTDIHELLFWIFDTVTFSMASKFELENRVSGQDFRILLFQKQEELLGVLDKTWEQQLHLKHQKLLK